MEKIQELPSYPIAHIQLPPTKKLPKIAIMWPNQLPPHGEIPLPPPPYAPVSEEQLGAGLSKMLFLARLVLKRGPIGHNTDQFHLCNR